MSRRRRSLDSNQATRLATLAKQQSTQGYAPQEVDIVTTIALAKASLEASLIAAIQAARRQHLWPRTFGWRDVAAEDRSPVSSAPGPGPLTVAATTHRSPVSSPANTKGLPPQ